MAYRPPASIQNAVQNQIQLNELGDVNITSVSNGDIIEWNGNQWVNVPNTSGGVATFADLTDTTFTALSTGEIVVYDGSSWVNQDFAKTGTGFVDFAIDRTDSFTGNNIDIGKITFYALNNTNQRTNFAEIVANVNDPSSTSEDAEISFRVQNNGTMTPRFDVDDDFVRSYVELRLANGSAANPQLTFADDTNTGIYRPGADRLAFVTGGLNRFEIDANGILKYALPLPNFVAGQDIITKSYADAGDAQSLSTLISWRLQDLADVSASSPSLNDVIRYNGTSWVTASIGATGLANWRGVWNFSANYIINDAVESNGSSYIAIAANTNSQPPNANWGLIAAAGSPGSNATIENNSVVVGTANTINFSSEFEVTDAGSGQIDVALSTNNRFFGFNTSVASSNNTTPVPIQINTEIRKDSIFVHNANDSIVTINKTGWFDIQADVSIGGANNRTSSESKLFINGSELAGSKAFGYHRNSGSNEDTMTIRYLLQVTSGDTIEIRFNRIGGNAQLSTLPNGTRLFITEIS